MNPRADTSADLRCVSDADPGITRVRREAGFSYRDAAGAPVTDREAVARIEALHVPPAWTEVWICADPLGHLQATGRDARGRKQYRYHDLWRVRRDEAKFDRMVAFGEALPRIRARVEHDLARRGTQRDKMLAVVVRLLDVTLVRIGNSEYARDNDSFGLTTLRDDHARIGAQRVTLAFRGKSGKCHEVSVADPRLARIVKKSRDLPGEQLFRYIAEDGSTRGIDSEDVNRYLLDAGGAPFTSKDFRTWGGTAIAVRELRAAGETAERAAARPPRPVVALESHVRAAIRAAAAGLGNTPAVARRAYVHPGVIERYLGGELLALWNEASGCPIGGECERLREEERVLLALVRCL